MGRVVTGEVLLAQKLTQRPACIPPNRPRLGSKRYGLRYERQVAERTGGMHGIWWLYRDRAGPHYCQTDVVLLLDGLAFVLECKLTEVVEARSQLAGLYLPVVSAALKREARGIVVVRHLSKESQLDRVVTSLSEALKCATPRYSPTLHWIGRGPL